uniref:Uncharacterized protein n=1 Tax=Tetranychus urticae TaxID=32264 RepID=T1KGR4_TETUR
MDQMARAKHQGLRIFLYQPNHHQYLDHLDLKDSSGVGSLIALTKSLVRAAIAEASRLVEYSSSGETSNGLVLPLRLGEAAPEKGVNGLDIIDAIEAVEP